MRLGYKGVNDTLSLTTLNQKLEIIIFLAVLLQIIGLYGLQQNALRLGNEASVSQR